jgi:hypothetical protein
MLQLQTKPALAVIRKYRSAFGDVMFRVTLDAA